MDREEIIKVVTKIYQEAQEAIEEIDLRAHNEKVAHYAKASDAEATLRMLDAIIPQSSSQKKNQSLPAGSKSALSPRNEVADAAEIVLRETGDQYIKASDIAAKVSEMGFHLGDSDAERTRRITVCLSAFSCFEAQRGSGWRLTSRWRQQHGDPASGAQNGAEVSLN